MLVSRGVQGWGGVWDQGWTLRRRQQAEKSVTTLFAWEHLAEKFFPQESLLFNPCFESDCSRKSENSEKPS